MDPNFPPEGDYDGDNISNLHEVFVYHSHPWYPTVRLSLHQGINLFYFPLNTGDPHIIPFDRTLFYYEDTWKSGYIKSNTFNAIYTDKAGVLCLDLCEFNHPVLCLEAFLDPEYSQTEIPDTIDYLNTHEVWSRFVQVEDSADPSQEGSFPLLRWDFDAFDPPGPDIVQIRLYAENHEGKHTLLVEDMYQTTQHQIKAEEGQKLFSPNMYIFNYLSFKVMENKCL